MTTFIAIAVAGLFWSEFVGYWYHRLFQHAIVLASKRVSDGERRWYRYLFAPWKLAFRIHMWHHYTLYPEPSAPGTEPRTFRPRHTYYDGSDIPENPYGIATGAYNPESGLELIRRYLIIKGNVDWLLPLFFGVVPAYLVLRVSAEFVAFMFGVALAFFLNKHLHDSFHVRPHPKLRDVPWRHWLKPAVFFANLGEHLLGVRRYYRYLFKRHLAHHYEVVRVDGSNVLYRGQRLNAQVVNFTMYNPAFDMLFGTESPKEFQEV